MEDLKNFIKNELNPLSAQIENLTKEVAETKQSVKNTEEIMNIAMNAQSLAEEAKKEIENINQRTDAMNSKVINMESRIEKIAESIDSKFTDLETKLEEQIKAFKEQVIKTSVSSWEELIEDDRSLSIEKRLDDIEKVIQNKTDEDERIKRMRAKTISKDISTDNPQISSPKILTWAEIMELSDHPNPLISTTGQTSNPQISSAGPSNIVNNTKQNNMIRIMADGRRRMGLYPFERIHMTDSQDPKINLNTAHIRQNRQDAVIDFLTKELRFDEQIKITQTKFNEKSINYVD